MTLGERIKYVRKSNSLNQMEYANKLGISQTHVSKIEKNVETPSETLLRFISYMFAINLNWLKTGEGEPDEFRGELKREFDPLRQQLEKLMRYMNHQQTADFLNIFSDFTSIYILAFDEKSGFEDDILKAYGEVIKAAFILFFHIKVTEDRNCHKQISLLKDSMENFIRLIQNK